MIMEAIQAAQSSRATPIDDSLDASDAALCSGDPGELMAALDVENGEAERTTAHQERDAEEAAETAADAAQLQAMHDEASSLRAQGVFDASTAVVGACLAVACPPAASGAATVGGLVAGHLSDGVEKLGDGFWKAAQHDDEARATAAKQHADAARNATDAANDANANLGAALDFDRNYTSIEAQTQLAALHRA
jgi:hypothetical protein